MSLFEVIRFTGPDAAEFLQGQLTQDVRRLDGEGALPAAWCNPKGRVVCVARLLDTGEGPGLAVPAGSAAALVRRFLVYRLRARVEIAVAEEWRAVALAGPGDLAMLETHGLLPPPRRLAGRRAHGLTAVEIGGRARCVELYGPAAAFGSRGLAPGDPLSEGDWRTALIEAGIPTVPAAAAEKYTPHMLNLDRLGAVSFSKGCYTGQEVVARTEHLGTVKRRLAHYRLDSGDAAPGDRLLHHDREAGEVVDAAGPHLLAVVPLDLHGRTLTLAGHEARPVPLP